MPDRVTQVRQKAEFYCGSFLAMGSPCELLVESDDKSLVDWLLDSVATEAWRVEDKYSRYIRGNIVDQINSSDGRPVDVDDETANLLNFAAALTAMSDGAFDITSGVLREAWHFDGSDNVPSRRATKNILERVGWHKVIWTAPSLTLRAGMQLDFGGIGKEYAVDRAAEIVSTQSNEPCLVNFGGDIFATAPPRNGTGWQVGIESPGLENRTAQKIIRLDNGALATSGDARRYLLKDGIRYSHILNPKTGWPIPDAPRSVTVAADTCTQAGMLATLAILQGNKAEAFLQQQDVQSWCFQ